MNAMLVAVMVIAVIGIIPVIIRKKLLKICLALLQNNDIKAIEDLIATKLAKICIPPFNREYLLLNVYLKLNDDKQIGTQELLDWESDHQSELYQSFPAWVLEDNRCSSHIFYAGFCDSKLLWQGLDRLTTLP